VIKNAVTSDWEAEVNAASDALDTMIKGRNICNELRYHAEFLLIMKLLFIG
jgi:hypothetical protein